MKFTSNLANSKTLWNLTAGFGLLVYTVGLYITIMEPDAATYAIIPMEMLQRNNFIELFSRGVDWLDKPHFQFWVTALSYKIFGINNLGYKIPAILFVLLSVRYTYLFGRRYYTSKTGYIAALMLITALHLILSVNDVRAEPYLLGLTIYSLYYLTVYLEEKKWSQLLSGCLGLACLMMTKGLFTIIPVVSAIFFSLVYQKNWEELFSWKWVAAAIASLLFITPVLYGYFYQFDLHPEKVVYGQTDVSGIKFFFWDSQWGRFVNTGPIKGKGSLFFYLHTLLWAFAPWAFLAYFALYDKTKRLIKRTETGENYTYFGFIVLAFILSFSRFQLPHYIVPLFPLLAILTANTLLRFARNHRFLKIFSRIQLFTTIAIFTTASVLDYYFLTKLPYADTMIIAIMVLILCVIIYKSSIGRIKQILFPPALAVLLVMYFMNRDFYPELMTYQSESEVAFYMNENNLPSDKLIYLDRNTWVTEFYLKRVIPVQNRAGFDLSKVSGKYVFCDDNGLETLKINGVSYEILKTFRDFHVTTMTSTFINKSTRNHTLINMYLVKVPEIF